MALSVDKPDPGMLLGVRDRAMLAVGLQVGFRRTEIAGLQVGDFHMNRGFDSLKVVRKGGKKGSLAIHPQAAQRIRDYLPKRVLNSRGILTIRRHFRDYLF